MITKVNVCMSKVSVGNFGHPKTPDTWFMSAMDKSFGLKILVLTYLLAITIPIMS